LPGRFFAHQEIRIVVACRGPPELRVGAGNPMIPDHRLDLGAQEISLECPSVFEVDAGDLFRIDDDRDHDPLKQRIAKDQHFQ